MGRHTAPIPIIRPEAPPVRPVTDPRLLDPAPVPAPPQQPPQTAALPPRRVAPVRPPLPQPRPATVPEARSGSDLFGQEVDEDGLDESTVDVLPRTAKSVLDAEADVPEEEPPVRILQVRDLVFAGAALTLALLAVAVAVAAALLPG